MKPSEQSIIGINRMMNSVPVIIAKKCALAVYGNNQTLTVEVLMFPSQAN